MIKELLDDKGKVNLITRPRRFGKTLNLSMLRRFFEVEMAEDGSVISNSYLFENLKIASCGEAYMSHQGQYPVISLSLKSAKQPNYEMAYQSLADEIAYEYKRHSYLLLGTILSKAEKERFQMISGWKASEVEIAKSLRFFFLLS